MQTKGNDPKETSKRPSVAHFLFNPDFGSSFRPLGESTQMFVRLIALIFVANGLFPRNHPALLGENGARLTLGEVVLTAWNGLSFTRAGLPKVLLFAAVCGCLLCSVLALITLLFSIFLGSAHAQDVAATTAKTTGLFDFSPETDLAQRWIGFLFLGEDITAAGAATVRQSNMLQLVMQKALGFYSGAILVFATVILLYHLISMIAETAHHGVPFGKKADQIWMPIRFVVALGLLVPIAGSGLNTGQYMVIQIAKWGSGLASNTWNLMLEGMKDSDYGLAPPSKPEVSQFVVGLAMMKACEISFNLVAFHSLAPGASMSASDNPTLVRYIAGSAGPYQKTGIQPGATGSFGNKEGMWGETWIGQKLGGHSYSKICGSFTIPARPERLSDAQKAGSTETSSTSTELQAGLQKLYDANLKVIDSMVSDAVNDDVARNLFNGSGKASSDIGRAAEDIVLQLPPAYQPNVLPTESIAPQDLVEIYLDKLDAAMDMSGYWKKAFEDVISEFGPQGWVAAGALFNTIARAQGAVLSASDIATPQVAEPALHPDPDACSEKGTRSTYNVTHCALLKYKTAIAEDNSSSTNTPTLAPTGSEKVGAVPPDAGKTLAIGTVLDAIDEVGQFFDVWPEGDGIARVFDQTANPLAEISYYGYQNLRFGLQMLFMVFGGDKIAAVAAVASGFTTGGASLALYGLAKLASFVPIICSTVAIPFIATGIFMAFYLPLLPFIKFFFGILTWLLTLFEAVVSIPLFALAHLTIGEGGLPGAAGKPGYFFFLHIFLRPVLMIFGLIAGFLLFFVSINFLNTMFNVAAGGSGMSGGQFAVIPKIIFSIIYAVLAYICANTCFKTINHFPEHALRWIGGASQPSEKNLGDPKTMGDMTAIAGAYFGSKASGFIGGKSSDLKGLKGFGAGLFPKPPPPKGPQGGSGNNALSGGSGTDTLGKGGGGYANRPSTQALQAKMPRSHIGASGSAGRQDGPSDPSNPPVLSPKKSPATPRVIPSTEKKEEPPPKTQHVPYSEREPNIGIRTAKLPGEEETDTPK